MSETGAGKPGSINLGLVLSASILLGFAAGYIVGQQGPIAATAPVTQVQGCPHDLDPSDEYIIAGFMCPNPADQVLLINCHCELAHQTKDWIKEELSKGRDGPEIRQALEERYGARLKPLGSQ
jgi:hypothetical protein